MNKKNVKLMASWIFGILGGLMLGPGVVVSALMVTNDPWNTIGTLFLVYGFLFMMLAAYFGDWIS